MVQGGKLGNTLVPGSNPYVPSLLVHQLSQFPFQGSTVVFASEYVRTEIYKRFCLRSSSNCKIGSTIQKASWKGMSVVLGLNGSRT